MWGGVLGVGIIYRYDHSVSEFFAYRGSASKLFRMLPVAAELKLMANENRDKSGVLVLCLTACETGRAKSTKAIIARSLFFLFCFVRAILKTSSKSNKCLTIKFAIVDAHTLMRAGLVWFVM